MWTVLARKRGMRDELILGRGEGQVILMGGRWYRGVEPDGADVAGCLVEISWCTSLDEPWCGVTDDLSASILTAPFLLSCWLVHCMILIRPSQGTQAANASDGMDAEGKIIPKFRKKSNKPSLTRKKNCSACCNRQKRSDEKSGEVWCPPYLFAYIYIFCYIWAIGNQIHAHQYFCHELKPITWITYKSKGGNLWSRLAPFSLRMNLIWRRSQ